LTPTSFTRTFRVPLDAGFTCPNRDGVRGFGGCTYCDDRGSGAPTINAALNVKEQLHAGIARIRRRFKAEKFLAYFQAFSNTYAPEGFLKMLYDAALESDQIVGLCIGTRPDCLPDNVLDLLAEYDRRTFLWLEIGLETAHDRTLDAINRGHSAEEFFDAVKRAKDRGLKVATHAIFGLPGESRAEMLDTIAQIATSGVDALKIHQLCIYKGTAMEQDYRAGRLPVLDEDFYVDLVADALEMLPAEMIIMRLVAEGKREELIAPSWAFEKHRIMAKIEARLVERGTRQASLFGSLANKTQAVMQASV
jgi:uncharacterized protein